MAQIVAEREADARADLADAVDSGDPDEMAGAVEALGKLGIGESDKQCAEAQSIALEMRMKRVSRSLRPSNSASRGSRESRGSRGSTGSRPTSATTTKPAAADGLAPIVIQDQRVVSTKSLERGGDVLSKLYKNPHSTVRLSNGAQVIVDCFNHRVQMKFAGARFADVMTLAGPDLNAERGFRDGRGKEARFNNPVGCAIDSRGQLLVTDMLNHSIRRVTMDGMVTTVAGTGRKGTDDGPATKATFSFPFGIAMTSDDTVIVHERDGHRIRTISPDGIVFTLPTSAP
jgi:hypothetical protein